MAAIRQRVFSSAVNATVIKSSPRSQMCGETTRGQMQTRTLLAAGHLPELVLCCG